MWQYRYNGQRFRNLILILASLFLFVTTVTFFSTTHGVSQGTDVNTSLYSTTDPPDVTITEPPASSVVNTNSITVAGTTINTTSIKIYVNDVLVAVVSTPSGSFEVLIPLNVGNNTIRVEGYSTYSGLTTEYTLIATYQPDIDDPVSPTDPGGEIPGLPDYDYDTIIPGDDNTIYGPGSNEGNNNSDKNTDKEPDANPSPKTIQNGFGLVDSNNCRVHIFTWQTTLFMFLSVVLILLGIRLPYFREKHIFLQSIRIAIFTALRITLITVGGILLMMPLLTYLASCI
jgi:hypothetical protein